MRLDDPAARTLLRVAQLAGSSNFRARSRAGTAVRSALQDDDTIAATLDACRAARIDVISLPAVNLYLQARRGGATPRWRGVTVLHEMKARGLRVAVAGDNCRDPFHAYGDHDMLETFGTAVRVLQLDHPAGDWIAAATSTPAAIMGLARGRIASGTGAELFLLLALTFSELLARGQSDRVVIRTGRAIDTTLPDYRLLDEPMDPPG